MTLIANQTYESTAFITCFNESVSCYVTSCVYYKWYIKHIPVASQSKVASSKWSEDERYVIEQYERYNRKSLEYLEKLKKNKFYDGELPVKPAEKLPTPTRPKTQKKKKAESNSKRTPEELLEFIIFNIFVDDKPILPVSLDSFRNVEELKTKAITVCRELCTLNKNQTLKNFELGFVCHQAKKKHQNYNLFIRDLANAYDVLGLSHSYVQKLIRFYKVFRNYKNLLYTSVNFTTLLNNLTAIAIELSTGKYAEHYNELAETEEQDDVEEELDAE